MTLQSQACQAPERQLSPRIARTVADRSPRWVCLSETESPVTGRPGIPAPCCVPGRQAGAITPGLCAGVESGFVCKECARYPQSYILSPFSKKNGLTVCSRPGALNPRGRAEPRTPTASRRKCFQLRPNSQVCDAVTPAPDSVKEDTLLGLGRLLTGRACPVVPKVS